MGWLDRLFGGSSKKKPAQAPSRQLPSSIVAKEFGEVNVRPAGDRVEVTFTILMEPEGAEAEGWQTGIALDASASMMHAYGHGLTTGPAGPPPQHLLQEYARKGWIQIHDQDGAQGVYWTDAASQDAIRRGHLLTTQNVVEPITRQMTAYLAGQLDADGGTTLVYWACGGDGGGVEVVGDFTEEQCETMEVVGPTNTPFGNGTRLLPAVQYFVDRFVDAERGMYIFLTDGRLDDLDAVKKYTTKLAKKIQAKTRNSVKCVLIGVGEEADEGQMEELDDLDTGTDVDIWDHKMAKEMRSLVEIFAEVVSENKIVAPTATIYDSTGAIAAQFADGLPAKVTFSMPASSKSFELEVGEQRIKQTVVG
ncbi:MAG: VWA domain-containing protein [Planctomycetia bacterium]|nr:VWA domain-containing protein [Planctomycetia bacterium]